MRTPKFFIKGILCLTFSLQTLFAQSLNTKISIKVNDATLPQVLQQIQKKYGYRFSYLNNELPANSRFSAEIKNKSFAEVLDVLLEKTDLGYKQSNGQIIIKKGFPKNKPKATSIQKVPVPAKPTGNKASQPAKVVSPTETPKSQEKAEPKNTSATAKPTESKPESPAENASLSTTKSAIPDE